MSEYNGRISTDLKTLIIKILMAVIGALNLILTVVYLKNINALLFYCALCLLSAMFVASILIRKIKSPIYKTLIVLNIAVLAVLIAYIALDYSGILAKISGIDELRALINRSGQWGIIVFFMLTLLQVVILPIPAAVTIVLGVIIYGPTVSFIVSTLGTIVGSVICFLLGRFFGYKLVAWIIGDDKARKYSDFITEKGKIPFIVMMLFPFFPDDILCMAAGLTKMSFKFFIISISLTRPIMIAFFSYFGTGEIIPFSGWGIPVWIALFAVSVILLYLINYLVNKKKNGNNKK